MRTCQRNSWWHWGLSQALHSGSCKGQGRQLPSSRGWPSGRKLQRDKVARNGLQPRIFNFYQFVDFGHRSRVVKIIVSISQASNERGQQTYRGWSRRDERVKDTSQAVQRVTLVGICWVIWMIWSVSFFGSLTRVLAIMLQGDKKDMSSSIFVYHLAWQILGIPRRSWQDPARQGLGGLQASSQGSPRWGAGWSSWPRSLRWS